MLHPPKKKAEKPKKFNLACIYADFNCTTGFGNVAKNLVDNFIENEMDGTQKLFIFSVNDFAKKPYQYKDHEHVTVIPALSQAENPHLDFFCRREFLACIEYNDFDVVFFLNDIEVVGSMYPELQRIKKLKNEKNRLESKNVFYFPVDSVPLKSGVQYLDFFDEVITYTQYGKDTIVSLAPQLEEKITVVPHGIDMSVFKPLPKFITAAEKEKLFGKDRFVIGSVNRNSTRKDISTTLQAFKQFKLQNPHVENSVLYLHMNPLDPAGTDLFQACEHLGLQVDKDVFFPDPKSFNENQGYSESELNIVYNLFDVFLTTSTAEGWGLTVTEAMACRVPCIVPMHTSLKEITADGEAAFPIREFREIILARDGNKIRFISDYRQIADTLTFIYNAPETADPYVKNAYEMVSLLDWSEISSMIWEKISKNFKK